VHITAYCPSCRSLYQLDPGLRGQRMRCPNPVCREVFEVQEEPDDTRPKPPGIEPGPTASAETPNADERPQDAEIHGTQPGIVRTTGTVGDLVQILDAEVVREIPAPAATSNPQSTAADVREAIPINPEQSEEAKPIPVDESLLPPPIEVERLIPLEPEEEGRVQPARELPSWHVPPPVRNPNARAAASPPADQAAPIPSEPPPPRSAKTKNSAKKPAPPLQPAPEETPPSWQAPPPVRRRDREPFNEPELTGAAPRLEPEPIPDAEITSSQASRRALWVIAAMVVVAGFLIASVTVMTLNAYVQTEAKRHVQAERDYEDAKYASAAVSYQNLVSDFPNSENHAFYELMAQWCQVRDQVYAAQADPVSALKTTQSFLKAHQSDPLLKPYKKDIGQTLAKLAEELIDAAQERSDPVLLAAAKDTLELSGRYYASTDNRADSEKIVQVQRQIAQRRKKDQLLAQLSRWLQGPPSVEMLKEARNRARREGLGQDPQIQGLVSQIEKAISLSVVYVPNQGGTPDAAHETVETSLRIVPVIQPAHPSTAPSRRAVLALVRGVLYALDPNTGRDLWATRVGIDTATLPVRLPATPASPELLLLLSADRNTIMALEPWTGVLAWRHRLSARCLGRPLVVGRKAFVPTLDDRIYEIETAKGNILGYFQLHQPLSVGGVQQQGTDLLYFPGDSDYLYVLNAQTQKCVAILHTGHPSGSLRSEPIIIHRTDPFAKSGEANKIPSYLVLAQNDGLDQMRLRVFELPIENPEPAPLLKTEPRTRGWSWFRPYYDGERLAFVTDAGIFSLFGIKQVRNLDDPIFPELPEKAAEPKQPPLRAEAGLLRGQVVHVADNDFWILANGELQRIHFDPFGPRTVPVWDRPLPLGSPMHASQVDDSTKTLFVVSQDLSRQVYLATAVAAEDGTIRWQRQLGLECLGDPLVLGHEVITLDRGGGLCIFDSGKYRQQANREWQRTEPICAPAVPGSPITGSLLPAPDGSSVCEVACSASTRKLTVRHYQAGRAGEKPPVLSEETVDLISPLAGTPALVGRSLLLPLADGTIRRFALPLAGGSTPQLGPDWRATGADDDARCHIVALSADEFIATNGSRGLTHWQWRQNEQTFQMIPMDKTGPTVELEARIVSAPAVLSGSQAGAECQVCVADSQGNITLLRGPELRPERTWSLHGTITAGPFRRGHYLGCVLDRHRLVWLDPAKAGTLWEYTARAEGIVGQPQLVNGLVVVADLSGRFIGLDPTTGKPRGPSYILKAAAAPGATPVAFGADTAFVPLTDGTVVLLPLRQLRGPLAASPTLLGLRGLTVQAHAAHEPDVLGIPPP
jgi:hypothetical protein